MGTWKLIKEEKDSLQKIAFKIKRIPKRFSDNVGNLDVKKVQLVLKEYQKIK